MANTVTTVALRTGPTLSYSDQGDASGPVLVLLPGPTDSQRSYQPVLEHVPSSIRAIAVSQRGHGDMTLLAFFDSVVSKLVDPIDPEFARSLLADTSSPDVAPGVLDQLAGETLKVPARVWQEMFAELLEYDDRSQLPRISAPALLIWGSADGVVNRPMQDQLQENIPSADLIVYEGLGHTPRWEDPIRFATDVTAFVERSLSAPS